MKRSQNSVPNRFHSARGWPRNSPGGGGRKVGSAAVLAAALFEGELIGNGCSRSKGPGGDPGRKTPHGLLPWPGRRQTVASGQSRSRLRIVIVGADRQRDLQPP